MTEVFVYGQQHASMFTFIDGRKQRQVARGQV